MTLLLFILCGLIILKTTLVYPFVSSPAYVVPPLVSVLAPFCPLRHLIKLSFFGLLLGMPVRTLPTSDEIQIYDKTTRRFTFDLSFLLSLPTTVSQILPFVGFLAHYGNTVSTGNPTRPSIYVPRKFLYHPTYDAVRYRELISFICAVPLLR